MKNLLEWEEFNLNESIKLKPSELQTLKVLLKKTGLTDDQVIKFFNCSYGTNLAEAFKRSKLEAFDIVSRLVELFKNKYVLN